jgi:superfamily II DNA or RNA helicase
MKTVKCQEHDDSSEFKMWSDKTWIAVKASASVPDELDVLKVGPVELRLFQSRVLRDIDEYFSAGKAVVSSEIYCAGGKTILAATVALQFLLKGMKVVFLSPKRSAFDHFRKEFIRILAPAGFSPDVIHIRLKETDEKWKTGKTTIQRSTKRVLSKNQAIQPIGE